MKPVKVLVSLIVDDVRLAGTLAAAIAVAAILSAFHLGTAAASVLWLGLVASLWFSIGHERRKQRR